MDYILPLPMMVSGKAVSTNIFLNGKEMQTVVDQDNLYKEITFQPKMQPALQFGAWERGKGLTNGKAKDITVFNRELAALEILQLAKQTSFNAILSTNNPLRLSPQKKIY
jgi:hypothetical protein